MLDWNALKLILEVHRAGSLTGAGQRLGINHATVSRQLARAESTLGAPFFRRHQTGLTATQAGLDVVAYAERMEAEALTLDASLATHSAEDEGPLAITVPPLLVDDVFAQDIIDFRVRFPKLEVSIFGANRVFNLHKREADIAIRISRDPVGSLWGRKICDQRSGLFCTPAFLTEHAEGFAGRAPLPLISFTAWDHLIAESISAIFPNAYVAMRCDDMVAAIALVRAGAGFTRMPYFLGGSDPTLVPVPDTPLAPYAPIWVLTHPDLRRTPRITQFMRFVATRFAARRARYFGPENNG
jgi:DNA-binding transcriptional LysR family regulator